MVQQDGSTYTTASGRVVKLRVISPFEIDEVRNSVPLPTPPVRKVETAIDGYEEEEPLAENDLRSEEEQARYRAYIKARDAATAEMNTRITDFLLAEGIEFEMSDLEEWKARRRRWKLPVPEDEMELRIAYVRTAVIGSVNDLENIVASLMESQGLDEREMALVRGSFRRRLRRDAPRESGDSPRQVDLQPAADGDDGGQSVGDGA